MKKEDPCIKRGCRLGSWQVAQIENKTVMVRRCLWCRRVAVSAVQSKELQLSYSAAKLPGIH